MAKNWAICIGVNRYDNLPDLKYPVRDAQLMRDFLLNEAGFDHVYLFTDDSAPITDAGKPYSSQPTYGTLWRFLRVRFKNKFLGVGVCIAEEKFWSVEDFLIETVPLTVIGY